MSDLPIFFLCVFLVITILFISLSWERNERAPRNIKLKGSIKVPTIKEDQPILVEAGAIVEADIVAPSVCVAGTVIGDITASKTVIILEEGVVEGTVTTSSLLLNEGAYLKGHTVKRRKPV